MKDRKQRLQAIGEGRILLEGGESEAGSQPAARPPARIIPWAVAALCAILAAGAVLAWAPWRTEPLMPLSAWRSISAERGLPAPHGPATYIALSPDGTRLAYVASVAGAPSRLYTRRLDQAKATELPGTLGASSPFFSPMANGLGSTAERKSPRSRSRVAPWSRSRTALPAATRRGAPMTVSYLPAPSPGVCAGCPPRAASVGNDPAGTSAEVKLTDLDGGEIGNVSPQFLPGGEFALYSAIHQAANPDTGDDRGRPACGRSAQSGGQRRPVPPCTFPAAIWCMPTGARYLQCRSMWISWRPGATRCRFWTTFRVNPVTGTADVAFANNGTLVYRHGGAG